MTNTPHDTYDWYDDADALAPVSARAESLPGLPEAWQHSGWWLAGGVFSILWILESWTAAQPSDNIAGPLSESVWSLLLALGICYGIYRFCQPRYTLLAPVLCVVSAIVLLLNHCA